MELVLLYISNMLRVSVLLIDEVLNPINVGQCLIRATVHFLMANYHGDAKVHRLDHFCT